MADTNPFAYSVPALEYAAEDDILVLGRGAGAVNVYARGFLRRDASGVYTTNGEAIVAGAIGCTVLSLRGPSTSAWQQAVQWTDSAGALKWSIGPDVLNNGGRNFYIWDAVDSNVRLLIDADDARLRANLLPAYDNGFNIGWSSLRWKDTYLVNSPTVTSDEREKLWIGVREDSRSVWLRIARRIFEELGFYQWRDAVEAKGEDGARWHFGARAQRVWAIVADEGLAPPLIDGLPDPAWTGPPPPAFLCFDRWEAEHEEEPVYSEALVGEDGKPLQIATRTVVARAAGHRFGFRVDQLGLLLDWSLHMEREADRVEIAELHARVAVLEAA